MKSLSDIIGKPEHRLSTQEQLDRNKKKLALLQVNIWNAPTVREEKRLKERITILRNQIRIQEALLAK
jgi:hypothetical protein